MIWWYHNTVTATSDDNDNVNDNYENTNADNYHYGDKWYS